MPAYVLPVMMFVVILHSYHRCHVVVVKMGF